MKKKYKKITVAGIVITLCLIITIFYSIINKKHNDYSNSDSNTEKWANADTERDYHVKEKVENATIYFTVQDCIQKFINDTYNNEEYVFKANEMYESVGKKITEYAVGGIINIGDNRQNILFKVNMDYFNMTYEVIPYTDYKSVDDITFENKDESIIKKDNNIFEYTRINDKQLCQIYYEDFMKLEMENPEEAYSKIEEEYKKIRFPTIQDYLEYVEDNKNMIELGLLRKYSYEQKSEHVECILSDSYDNIFTVYATNVMNYKIRLDNYTISTDTQNEEYSKMSEKNKVAVNCYKFIKMVNSKDYIHLYEHLDDTFKQNNYENIEDFKDHIKVSFYDYNVIQDTFNIRNDNDKDYYVVTFKISNNDTLEPDNKNVIVVIKLEDNDNYVMSFSFE